MEHAADRPTTSHELTIQILEARFGQEKVERALKVLRYLAYDDEMRHVIQDEREILLDLFRTLEG